MKNKQRYIVTSEPKERFNSKGESVGISDKMAVFYLPSEGRRCIYRQSMVNPDEGLELLIYNSRYRAEEICAAANMLSNDEYRVEVFEENEK